MASLRQTGCSSRMSFSWPWEKRRLGSGSETSFSMSFNADDGSIVAILHKFQRAHDCHWSGEGYFARILVRLIYYWLKSGEMGAFEI